MLRDFDEFRREGGEPIALDDDLAETITPRNAALATGRSVIKPTEASISEGGALAGQSLVRTVRIGSPNTEKAPWWTGHEDAIKSFLIGFAVTSIVLGIDILSRQV